MTYSTVDAVKIMFFIILGTGSALHAQLNLEIEGYAQVTKMDTISSAQDTTSGNVVRLSDGTLALRQYKIGDLAQGGMVFWVDETGEHGLVSALSDLESAPGDFFHEWSTIIGNTGASGGELANNTGGGIGAGAMNTLLIISAHRGESDSPSRLSLNLLDGGYGDWYLPSKGELFLLHQNLHLTNLLNFASNNYWSSTEASASFNFAWVQSFNIASGAQSFGSKTTGYRGRAIRAF